MCGAHLRLGSEDGVEEQGAGATEGVRELRSAHPDDLINPLLGGLGSGALLGRLQGRGAADEDDEDDGDDEDDEDDEDDQDSEIRLLGLVCLGGGRAALPTGVVMAIGGVAIQ